MKLDQALVKIGVTIVDVDKGEDKLTLLLRVHTDDPRNQSRWTFAASSFVRKVWSSKKGKSWSGEISKVLMTLDGEHVVFFWRVILSGRLATAQRVFGESVLEALREGVEVTSMPLVGQKQYEHNPAEGKIKGGYPVGGSGASAGPSLVSNGFRK